MKVLLDTNIVIHREAATVVNEDIGVLFKWLDNLHHTKCIHPVTAEELTKHDDPRVKKSLAVKLGNYNILKTQAPMSDAVAKLSTQLDKTQNDVNDTLIVNELYSGRVDLLITEDKNVTYKASLLGISDRVFTIEAFLEKVTAENPELVDYRVLSVRKEYFGNLDPADEFFMSFKEDYPDYKKWFNRKAQEVIYVCRSAEKLTALLYLKREDENENYSDIDPPLPKKKRLKIGSFKVTANGFRLGERFLKIIFDNALLLKVDEIYVTIFNKRTEQQRLINLLEEYGFRYHGVKTGPGGRELVYVRPLVRIASRLQPKLTYPFFSTSGRIFIVSIYPEYHTELFPDSILRTESPMNFVENAPHRNAISKVFVSWSLERNLNSGDVIVFYRTGGYYRGVVTTIGVIEQTIDRIQNKEDFIRLCRKRSVFSDAKLAELWNDRRGHPFIVNFLYIYSFPQRINMKRLIEIGVIPSVNDAPRGFTPITVSNLRDILKECRADEGFVIS